MATKRIFIAVDISDDARRRAAEYIGKMRELAKDVRVGWERPEKLHVTLKFLGNVDEPNVEPISQAIAAIAGRHSRFEMSVTGTGVFPRATEARVLWLGIDDRGDALSEIASQLDSSLSRFGFKKEKRRFSQHLTIARIREPQKAKGLADAHLQSRFEPVSFTVSGLILYESELKHTGSAYNVLAAYPFVTLKPLT